jgi:hypothetical protein
MLLVLVMICGGLSAVSWGANARLGKPVILAMLEDKTGLELGRLIDVCNKAYADDYLKMLENDARGAEPGSKVIEAYEKAKAAILAWKGPLPYPSGVAYVVILEQGGQFCVGYYPVDQSSVFICYVGKDNYTPQVRPMEKRMKAINLGDIGVVIP